MKRIGCILGALILIGIAGAAHAATYNVKQDGTGDFTAIQDAIDAAADGDEIVVHPGTYYENIRFNAKNLALVSTNPKDRTVVEMTVIDGGGYGAVVTFDGTESEDCLLAGFKITNGDDSGINCAPFSASGPFTMATITDCIVTANEGFAGGGIVYCGGLIDRCIVSNNSASGVCGGLFGCGGTISNCLITGNRGGTMQIRGGGLASCDGAIVNCTIAYNSAWEGGGLSMCYGDNSNLILWGNEGGELCVSSTTYSCVQGGANGAGNISDDPQFIDPLLGDYRLSPFSPCANAGSESAGYGNRDLEGNPRIVGSSVDMGAFEYPFGCYVGMLSDKPTYSDRDQLTLELEVRNLGKARIVDVYAAVETPLGDLLFLPWIAPDWTPCFSSFELEADISARPFVSFGAQFTGYEPSGTYRSYAALSSAGSIGEFTSNIFIGSFHYSSAPTNEYTVKPDGTGDFPTIQAAIDGVRSGASVVIHPGIYFENLRVGNRDLTVRSIDPDDPSTVEATIVDGRDEGSVVTFTSDGGSILLGGITLKHGFAAYGGGILWSRPVEFGGHDILQNCIISDSSASEDGGGIYAFKGDISSCSISGNRSEAHGGGLSHCDVNVADSFIGGNESGLDGGGFNRCSGLISNCTISENIAGWGGGGFSSCPCDIEGCSVIGNRANQRTSLIGGAGGLDDCGGDIINCLISGNRAASSGAGLCNCDGLVSRCVITENAASESGGAIYGGSGRFERCVISDNSAPCGGAVSSCWGSFISCLISNNGADAEGGGFAWGRASIVNCTVAGNSAQSGGGFHDPQGEIINTIIWNNTAKDSPSIYLGSCIPTHCCIESWGGGGSGNISEDPLFVDFWTRDFRLQSASPCIDAGDSNAQIGDVDLDGSLRIIGDGVDIGAYEFLEGCSVTVAADRDMYVGQDVMEIKAEVLNIGCTREIDLFAALKTVEGEFLFLPALDDHWAPWASGVELGPGETWSPKPFDYAFTTLERGDIFVIYALVLDHISQKPISNVAEFTINYHRGFALEFSVKQDGSGDFDIIQHAIDCAMESDTIVVHPGLYLENVSFDGKNLTLTSLDPLDPDIVETTVIDGGQNGSVIELNGTENETCKILGLSITNGSAESGGGIRAGIGGWNPLLSKIEIANCRIFGNAASFGGGGISGCDGLISDCEIWSNSAFHGGGLYDCSGMISNCLIADNSAGMGGGGVSGCQGLIVNCLISGNCAHDFGGGLCNDGGRSLINCTIANNSAPLGSAIHHDHDLVRDCIVWGNTGSEEPNRIYGSISFCCIQDWPWAGEEGCIDDNPIFVTGPFGGYYLHPDSPCIDAGSQSAVDAGLSNRTTQADGTPDTGKVDMGYHYPLP
ncbi:MAG: hypothetical protein JW941_01085 [Candidatus Coatesbacteria bacterium]|nr:hypothetical protein [Candidatus Coatesbacteria bacterium]